MTFNDTTISSCQDPTPWARGDGGRMDGGACDDTLVTTPITPEVTTPELQLFRRSLRVKNQTRGNKDATPPDRTGKNLQGFSQKSKSRLRFTATNNSHRIKSQFCLTYHNNYPTDGKICKKHLFAWLQFLRDNLPEVGYLWILEFQSRGAAHYHVFLTIEPSVKIQRQLATAWNRITKESPEHLDFHLHSTNWIHWDIGTGQYLAKYLDKHSQKMVPENFRNVGRFWGNSTCMKPEYVGIPLDELEQLSTVDQNTGELYGGKETILRWIGRLAEKQTRGYSRFRVRVAHSSYTILDGIRAYDQIERYFSDLNHQPSKGGFKQWAKTHN